MCALRLGTVLAMYLREVVITWFIASPVAREGIGDPTTMLARSAVEAEPARTMGVYGRCSSTGACLLVSNLLQARLLGRYSPKRFGKHAQEGLGPMDATSRQRGLYLRAAQTHCGNEGNFGNHEGGERLVGLGVKVMKEGEEVRR